MSFFHHDRRANCVLMFYSPLQLAFGIALSSAVAVLSVRFNPLCTFCWMRIHLIYKPTPAASLLGTAQVVDLVNLSASFRSGAGQAPSPLLPPPIESSAHQTTPHSLVTPLKNWNFSNFFYAAEATAQITLKTQPLPGFFNDLTTNLGFRPKNFCRYSWASCAVSQQADL